MDQYRHTFNPNSHDIQNYTPFHQMRNTQYLHQLTTSDPSHTSNHNPHPITHHQNTNMPSQATSSRTSTLNFLQIQERYYMCCPQLYLSFKKDQCLEETTCKSFRLRRYEGRNELCMTEAAQIEVVDVMKLTVWRNGDYKMIYNDWVYFWHEGERCLDKYCKAI